MATSVSALLSGAHPPTSSSSLSSSFVPRSQRLATSSCSSPSFSHGNVSARCRTMSPELECVASPSLYALLGLEQDVALTNIKTAYRQMARRYHPDVCPASEREECTKMFLQVQDAYEILSDPERRADYDYRLVNALSGNGLGWGNYKTVRRERRDDLAAWRNLWEDQLARFERRTPQSNTWGARMRAWHAAQN